ncbi:MAG: hypothetical protein KKG59_06565 [Nanoarchaeota archaeon]|nr:hypothetical protein [Nanoarchaeota archaeon]
MTTSTEISLLDREALEWYALIRASKKGEPVEMLLGAHQQKYGWIGMSEKNDVWSIKHYEKQFVRDKELDVDALTNKKNVIKRDLLEAQEELAKEYSLDSDSLSLLETIKKLSEVRLGTRLSWVLSGYYIDLLFQEISKRVGIDKEELNMYKADEMDTLLRSGEKVDVEVRKNYSVKLDNGKIEYYFGLSETKIMEDTELPKVDYSKVTEVKGSIANHGKVTGRVKKIYSFSEDQDKEIRDMKKGDILVTGMTRPHLMLALRKCGAIVTDEGGITSHAAIISRELNKPCVIGTKIATKVFNDGDMVEVDADKGIVRKIR